MDRGWRLPPGFSFMKGVLGCIANFRGDGTGNNERHHTIRMEMRRRARSWRVNHFDQSELTLRLAGQALLDYFAPRGFFQNSALLGFALAGKQLWRKRGNRRHKRSRIEAPPAHNRSRHDYSFLCEMLVYRSGRKRIIGPFQLAPILGAKSPEVKLFDASNHRVHSSRTFRRSILGSMIPRPPGYLMPDYEDHVPCALRRGRGRS